LGDCFAIARNDNLAAVIASRSLAKQSPFAWQNPVKQALLTFGRLLRFARNDNSLLGDCFAIARNDKLTDVIANPALFAG
jgi:hypothetical protein